MTSFSGVTFLSRIYAFIEAAALRSIALRHAGAPIATRVSFFFFFFVFGDVAFSEYFCAIVVFSLYGEYAVHFFPFRMVFFYLVTTGWILEISLQDNSINEPINTDINTPPTTIKYVL